MLTFPPLERTIEDIRTSENIFYAVQQDDICLGIIETEESGDSEVSFVISSLAVLPHHSRRGIGKRLVQFVLERAQEVVVTTAEKNLSVISLYAKLGLNRTKEFITPEGIRMVEMRKSRQA